MRHDKPFRVRFWNYSINGGFVRLSLADGQTIRHESGGPNDEGYSYSCETFTRDGDTVRLTMETTARDCDGRLDNTTVVECNLTELDGREAYDDPTIRLPDWTRRNSYQRDYEAERAGY